MKTHLTTKELAELADISERAARKAFLAIMSGETTQWRGAPLVIEVTEGNRGRDGKNYQVAVESLPVELKEKYQILNPVKPVLNTDLTVATPSLSMFKTPKSPASTEVPARAYSREMLWGYWSAARDSYRLIAQCRLDTLQRVEERIAQGMTKTDAIRSDIFETQGKIDPLLAVMDKKEAVARTGRILADERTIYRWYDLVADKDPSDWLPALLPSYVGNTSSLNYNPKIFDFFVARYLHRSQPGFQHTYNFTKKEAEIQGWGVMPSIATLRRDFNRKISPQVRDLGRLGEDAETFKRIVPPLTRDKSGMKALEWINGDGYDHNLWVIFPDGEVARPTTWIWQDVYSGMLLGFCVDKTENSDILRISLRNTIRDYGLGVNGVPFKITTDNTPNAAAKVFTGQCTFRFRYKHKEDDPIGIFKRLGIDYRPSTPGEPQTKPIERKNKDIAEYVDKDPYLVDQSHTAKTTTLTYAYFLERLQELLDERNRAVSRSPICRGKYSPLEVFQESLSRNAVYRATEEQLNMLLLCVKSTKVDPNNGSIHFWDNVFWHEKLAALAGKPSKSVMIEYDPYDLRQDMNVYHLNNVFICTAKYIPSVGYSSESDGRLFKRTKVSHQKAVKKELTSRQKLAKLERDKRVPKPPEALPKAKIITPVRTEPVVEMRAAKVVTPAPVIPIKKRLTQVERNELLMRGIEVIGKQRAAK